MACPHTQELLVRLSLLLAVLAVIALPVCQGYHLHCAKWRQSCEKHEEHNCSGKIEASKNEQTPHEWTSCCVPQTDTTRDVNPSDSGHYKSAMYTISTGKFSTAQVWCDMTTERGGWLTILRRTEGVRVREKFNLYWESYMAGFGHLESEFWLGLRTMQTLTAVGDWELRVDLYDHPEANVSSSYAKYNSFKVGNHPGYKLELGTFNGYDSSTEDRLSEFNGQDFIVLESRQDRNPANDCAVGRGGWWYQTTVCQNKGSVLTKRWHKLKWGRSFSKYEMKIRPKQCFNV